MAYFRPGSVPALQLFERTEGWSEPVSGHYDYIGGILTVLYRFKGELFIRLGERDFEVSKIESIWHLKKGENREFGLTTKDGSNVKLEYSGKLADSIDVVDMTPFSEEEDFDFGLFVKNVINNPDRSDNIYRQ
ncbi:hypothetical protein [Amycolatopsis aidingensis]|uniref:hypothetical protein n=1 Tax=Amycolatopsis aidingensis TaxID=2842453 RepID=UPI001C0CFA7B|nr:hypothetical protein [Amycolatopsis aidingensis]